MELVAQCFAKADDTGEAIEIARQIRRFVHEKLPQK